jgi:hypothetical protein
MDGSFPPTRGSAARRVARRTGTLALVLASLGAGGPSANHAAGALVSGEELSYRMRVGSLGTVGEGKMTVGGPVDVRGTSVLVIRAEFRSNVRLVAASDVAVSWVDPRTFGVLRYHKRERHPLSSHEERVDVFPAERRWRSSLGEEGRTASVASLDELSFIYFIRTLPLRPNESYSLDRHFDADRNPVRLRVVARERVTVGAGEFASVLVEMRVIDPKRYRGTGVLRIHLSDDARRLPLRIESSLPGMGTTVLTLENFRLPPASGGGMDGSE